MFQFDSLAITSILTYMLLWGITIVAAPKRDLRSCGAVSLVLILVGALVSYSAGSIWIFLAGWFLTAVPSLLTPRAYSVSRVSTIIGLTALLAGAIVLSMSPGTDTARTIAFGAFVFAALLRAGVFPFQFWTSRAFDGASLPALNLWLNSHQASTC